MQSLVSSAISLKEDDERRMQQKENVENGTNKKNNSVIGRFFTYESTKLVNANQAKQRMELKDISQGLKKTIKREKNELLETSVMLSNRLLAVADVDARVSLEEIRNLLINPLAKGTHLDVVKPLRLEDVECANSLVDLGVTDGNYDVFKCFQLQR